jgi:hypothetical protein
MDDLLNNTCQIYTGNSSPDLYGKVVWTNPVDTACRFVKTNKMTSAGNIGGSVGEDILISAIVQVADNRYDIGTRLDFLGKRYKIEFCEEWVDGDGDIFGCRLSCSNFPV